MCLQCSTVNFFPLLHSSGKQEKKSVRSVERTKKSGPQPVRPVTAVSAPAVKNEEIDEFPEIETMSRRHQEPDECETTSSHSL